MTAGDPALPDREAMLALAVREITAAWESFDPPRPKEAVLDEAHAQRLLDPLPEAPGDPPRPCTTPRGCWTRAFVNFRTTDEQVDDVVGVIRELGGQIRK